MRAKMPIGIAFAFLTTSPLVNEVVVVIMGGMFGWKIAFSYALIGILLGVFAGFLIDFLKLEKEVITENFDSGMDLASKKLPDNLNDKLKFAYKSSKNTFKKLWWIVLIGVGIGSLLHGYIPQQFFMGYLSRFSYWAVPLAVIIGIPIYAGCSYVAPFIIL